MQLQIYVILIHIFPQIVVQPNLTSMGSNKTEFVAFKCANHHDTYT